ncbi:hypothetical protein CRD60_03050 [Bifidobacterium aemilianum]|uniref:ABC3 transporter permease C-terminal domain-containing protein n=2 Tax=Bifidobacterium aemilianum TaxID=2493120 RepID=A0A366KAK6_9BIFI|nr:hypothetical protein CRD60_03050 [Bifidobacterium aemilianum]
MLVLLAIMLSSAKAVSTIPDMDVQGRTGWQNLMTPFVALPIAAVLIIPQVVSSLIAQRRRNLALLALQGATPWQLTGLTCLRVLILALAASCSHRPPLSYRSAPCMLGRRRSL